MSFEEGSSQGAPDIRVVGQVIAGVQIVGMFELRFQVGASRYQLLHRLAAGHISVLTLHVQLWQ